MRYNLKTNINRWLIVYYIVLTVVVTGLFFWYISTFDWTEPRFSLLSMVNGTAYRPYVYRVLVPMLINVLTMFYAIKPEIYAAAIMFLALFGFGITMRSFALNFWNNARISYFVSLTSIMGLFPFLIRDGKIYDFPDLLLFTLGLYLMARKQWGWFLLVYLLGCLNKETTVFLSLVFVATFWKMNRTSIFWKLLLSQSLIFLVSKIVISWIFRYNPGGQIELHLTDQLIGLLNLPYFLILYSSFAVCASIFVLVDWNKKPAFLRIAAICLIPVVLIFYFLFAAPYEIRNLLNLYPVLFLLSVPTLGRIIRLKFPVVP